MAYGSREETKFDYGATLAAALTYLLLKQQDAVGICTFSDKIDTIIPPKSTQSHLFAILEVLKGRKPAGETSAGAILQVLTERLDDGLILAKVSHRVQECLGWDASDIQAGAADMFLLD